MEGKEWVWNNGVLLEDPEVAEIKKRIDVGKRQKQANIEF